MKKSITTIAVCVALNVACLLVYHFFLQKKEAYINANEVFEKFLLKKQLEADYKNTENAQKSMLDSIGVQVRIVQQMLERAPKDAQKIYLFELKQQEYVEKKRAFDNANEELMTKYNEQIWTQINQYMKDFGQAHHYDYIYGATGDGALMYAKDKNNITEEVVTFINNRYEGKN